ncbi:hypothetical protein [Myroides marinus]|uniref:hypothetical protein n=1 Tax=Myroides marinus TaxID=703342 RepID=UPI002576D742|nr:hypothetical protein [Myroides marinus]MDM1369216.1 hypothetical protein [Myroides marinus]MDM1383652.1 hypothetical protein [Myroides marinus]
MKALFRLIVLCFFLSQFGLAFASQKGEVKLGYTTSDKTLVSDQVCKKDSCKVYCQTEVEVELMSSVDAQDNNSDRVGLGDVFSFLLTSVFDLDITTPFFGEQQTSAYLQQHRAKYLLYQSFKIPHGLV